MDDVKYGKTKEVTLTGQVFAYSDSQGPVLLNLPQLGPSFALFKTVEDFKFYMKVIGVKDYTIKKVDDGKEFLSSKIPYPIVCDMQYEGGKSKWSLVLPESYETIQ